MNAKFDGERTLADVVMAPTRIYVKQVLALLEKVAVKGMAHITGGGLLENVPRVLPENVVAELSKAAWPRPKLFDWMQAEGNVAENEMHRVFNCGIGLVIVVAAADADAAIAELKAQGEAVYNIGKIRARQGDEAQTLVV
jgi:phosphoribosylformylglycinamidine cyclo-ligase